MRMMLATVEKYGINQGKPSDSDVVSALVRDFSEFSGWSDEDLYGLDSILAAETAGRGSPIAVDVAWALASLLNNRECLEFAKVTSTRNVNVLATCFHDEFPQRIKDPVLGKKVFNWRIPAAYAAAVLIFHAEIHELPLNGPDE